MSTTANLSQAELKFSNHFQGFFQFFRPERIEENVTSVVYMILRNTGIKVTFSTIVEYLKSHPNYPSLKSICDLFNEMNITNYPLKLDEYDLYNLSNPFIAHTKESGGKVLLVYSINKEQVVYADSLNGKRIITTQQFLEKWDGVVIAIEPSEFSGEVDYTEKRKNEIVYRGLLPSVILVLLMALVFGIITNKSFSVENSGISLIVLLFTHLAGLIFSILLFRHELNLKTKFTDKLCHITTNTDCDAVTKSKASKIFGNVTWADAGIAYFTGGLLIFFLLPVTYSLNNLALFSILALPYPVFSILYQWLKIKKWCLLCISVQCVLVVESFFAINIFNIRVLTIVTIILVLIVFSIAFLIVLLLKFLFIVEREKAHLNLESLKLKRDPELFLYKLKKEARLDLPFDKSALIFGDVQSEVLISVFLSFHCGSCARKFDEIRKLLARNVKFKVQLIFSSGSDDLSVRLLKTLFEFTTSGQSIKALEFLTEWYNTDIRTRSLLFGNIEIQDLGVEFDNMINYNSLLFKLGMVDRVPSVYINGYPLTKAYSLEDIRFHISELEKMQKEFIEIEV